MFFFYIVRTSERCQSGRLGRSRNPESVTGPRVRIPLSPEKIWSPLWAPYFFIRDTPNPRRGFDRRLRNEVKRRRLRFWPKARTRRAAMERSDNAVSSLSLPREGRKTSLCQALEQSRLERPLKTRIRRQKFLFTIFFWKYIKWRSKV